MGAGAWWQVFGSEIGQDGLSTEHVEIRLMTTETLIEFLAWSSVVNIAILAFSAIAVIMMRGAISRIHSNMFGLDEKDLGRAYFQYLAQYKIAVIVLNIAPYLALRIIT